MPKKLLHTNALPSLVAERLRIWGRCIHTQRITQRITAADLCSRLGISEATMRRMERGDPGSGAGNYLAALLILGVIDEAAPALAPSMWSEGAQRRVKLGQQERGSKEDADYF
jgi:transcriptional regulator with XRE-family HTH domain